MAGRRIADSARILAFIICSVGLSLVAAAQDATYSADSLMAAFKPGSQISLKGTTITFTGTIAEIARSRLIFRSSGNDRVICELVSTANGNGRYVVGNHVTVIGKVRGRGALGNVTLDQCNPVVPNVSQEPATEVSEIIEVSNLPEEEPVYKQPLEIGESDEIESTSEVADSASTTRPIPAEPAKSGRAIVAIKPKDGPLPNGDKPSSPAIEESDEATKEAETPSEISGNGHPDFTNAYLEGVLHTLAAIVLGISALLAFVKLWPLAAGFRKTSDLPPTEEMRRAALKELLLKQEKKKH